MIFPADRSRYLWRKISHLTVWSSLESFYQFSEYFIVEVHSLILATVCGLCRIDLVRGLVR